MAKKMTKEELKAKMMANKKSENKKETVEMTNIEILNSVDAGDYEAEEINEALNIDYSFNTEENDDELVDEPVAIKKGKKKATETQGEKEARWLKNAKLTDDGKYQIEVDPTAATTKAGHLTQGWSEMTLKQPESRGTSQ